MSPAFWAFLAFLLVGFYLFVGWLGARVATRAMPEPDLRERPSSDLVEAACTLLDISLPANDDQIKSAGRKLYPRCPGDRFEDGTPRIDKLNDVLDAVDLLVGLNAFETSPPFEAKYLLAYWNYRAGLLGRLWAWISPPPIVQRLRLQMVHESA